MKLYSHSLAIFSSEFRRLLQVDEQASVDEQGRARAVARQVRRKEDGRACDVVRCGDQGKGVSSFRGWLSRRKERTHERPGDRDTSETSGGRA